MVNEITVLVKKTDGTTVRMTLDEVKALKQKSKQANGASSNEGAAPAMSKPKKAASQIVQNKSNALVKTEVVEAVAKDNAAVSASAGDFTSPLEEQPPLLRPNAPIISDGRNSEVDNIIKSLSAKVAAELAGRLRTIIQLFLKEVRTKDQTKGSLVRGTADGGMGLGILDAEEVIQKSEKFMTALSAGADVEVPDIKTLKARANLPAVSTPFNSFQHSAKIKTSPVFSENKSEDATYVSAPAAQPEDDFKLASTSAAKKTMQDIVPSEPEEISPIEEIMYFSLVDFRRLAHNPEEAAMRLKQKFVNLKEESVSLYLVALDAWKKSPLYLDYVGALVSALAQQNNLKSALGNNAKIQYNEVTEIAKMNMSL